MELQINRGTGELNASVKAENEELGTYFARYVEECFGNWGLLAGQLVSYLPFSNYKTYICEIYRSELGIAYLSLSYAFLNVTTFSY